MISRNKPHNGIADFAVARRKRKPDFFDAVGKAIDWEPISKFLNKKLNRKANVVGNPAYPALLMFKILLLQKWYKLSDPAMEEMLINHLGFLRFVGLSVEQDVPDETTICRFRNGLVALGILEKVNEMILMQLEHAGVLVREGAIVDASIIESACRPRKVTEVMPEDRNETDLNQDTKASEQFSEF